MSDIRGSGGSPQLKITSVKQEVLRGCGMRSSEAVARTTTIGVSNQHNLVAFFY